MLVIIKSAPDTTDGVRGLTLAREGGGDLILLQNGSILGKRKGSGLFPALCMFWMTT